MARHRKHPAQESLVSLPLALVLLSQTCFYAEAWQWRLQKLVASVGRKKTKQADLAWLTLRSGSTWLDQSFLVPCQAHAFQQTRKHRRAWRRALARNAQSLMELCKNQVQDSQYSIPKGNQHVFCPTLLFFFEPDSEIAGEALRSSICQLSRKNISCIASMPSPC